MARTRPVFRYRIRNWREYNRALINRGRLTVWFDEHAILLQEVMQWNSSATCSLAA